jgi:hypothetical protein
MQEIKVTHAFVKKLTKNIRNAYGNQVPHTKVLELIADAAGRQAGPMMHELKQLATTMPETASNMVSTSTFTFEIARRIQQVVSQSLGPTSMSERETTVDSLLKLLDLNIPLSLLLKGLVCQAMGWGGKNDLLKAFEADSYLVEVVSATLGTHSREDPDGEEGAVIRMLIANDWFPVQVMVAAGIAIDYGFLEFQAGKPVVKTPRVLPREYGYDRDQRPQDIVKLSASR